MENSNSNSMLTLVTKNLIQNPLKLRENPEAYLSTSHLTTGRRLPAQYEESLEPEDWNRLSLTWTPLQYRTEAINVPFFLSSVINFIVKQLAN